MSEEFPKEPTLRVLRYIEPGSDSPWHEVLGLQDDGTFRPQWYSQLELPKIQELLKKSCRVWFPPEVLRDVASVKFFLSTEQSAKAKAQGTESLKAQRPVGSSASIANSFYLVTLNFIFLSTELKALARAAVSLYTPLNTAMKATSEAEVLELVKGAEAKIPCSELLIFDSLRSFRTEPRAQTLQALSLGFPKSSKLLLQASRLLRTLKPIKTQTACVSRAVLDFTGYGYGFYGKGLYGV